VTSLTENTNSRTGYFFCAFSVQKRLRALVQTLHSSIFSTLMRETKAFGFDCDLTFFAKASDLGIDATEACE
jgi:hypothetical protein